VSAIRVTVGSASVELEAHDRMRVDRTVPFYAPRDLVEATASALLAVDTDDAVRWARALWELVTPAEFPSTDTTVPPPL
jgi:hypothetical protein